MKNLYKFNQFIDFSLAKHGAHLLVFSE